jgi:hypothetical protein
VSVVVSPLLRAPILSSTGLQVIQALPTCSVPQGLLSQHPRVLPPLSFQQPPILSSRCPPHLPALALRSLLILAAPYSPVCLPLPIAKLGLTQCPSHGSYPDTPPSPPSKTTGKTGASSILGDIRKVVARPSPISSREESF